MKTFMSITANKQEHNAKHFTSVVLWILPALLLLMFSISACGTPVSATPPSKMTQQDRQQLQVYQHWIDVMKQSGGDVKTYQKLYTSDSQALQTADTDAKHKAAQKQLATHIADIQLPALKTEATFLRKHLQDKVAAWGQQHQYTDSYDGITYTLGYEYGANGADGLIEDAMNNAQTADDYQQIVDNLHTFQTNFDAMVTNADDKTPYDQVHKTDMQLLKHYKLQGQRVVVVSLQEQALRVYDSGQLVKAFLATTGRPTHPSLPGLWQVEDKLSPTVFKSGAEPGSPDYYPDTPINYAMQYHSDGYFIHDSWWRANYGPGTNFPHADDTGNDSASTGSHGCVNLSTDDAAWVYNFVDINTAVLIY